MRLIDCRIENFGKLSQMSFSFSEGLNAFTKENGWGKTTLAAFLRVMLYGFENEKGRTTDRERDRYAPWQGGVCGGELSFEVRGREYTMYRTFGKKASEDTFRLFDRQTGLESKEYDENVGEELFGIDAEGFKRTIFLGQGDCISMPTDSIYARLGELTLGAEDMDSYEAAMKRIGDMLNAFSPTRKTGLLYKKRQEAQELRRSFYEEGRIREELERIGKRQEECAEQRADLEETRNRLRRMPKQEQVATAKHPGSLALKAAFFIIALGVGLFFAGENFYLYGAAALAVGMLLGLMGFDLRKHKMSGQQQIYELIESQADALEQMDEIGQRLEELRTCELELTAAKRELQRKLEQLEKQRGCLYELEQNLTDEENRYKLLQQTAELLTQAKRSLTDRYREPVWNAFCRFYAIMNEECEQEHRMDADLKLTVVEQNQPRDLKQLSKGTGDLYGICMRAALVEAMYSDEKPFLILDDPFVNLDDSHLEAAKAFLEILGQEYQLLYFTCQESRRIL